MINKNLNEFIFDNIDTEEKAYWLGFIFADGTISSTRFRFELSLSLKDIDHLEKFRQFIGYIKPLKIEKAGYGKRSEQQYMRCRLYFNSKHLHGILNSYGCTPRKSLTLQFPKKSIFKTNSLIRHFLRGYIDGDGCITYATKDHSGMNLNLLGTKQFLVDFQNNLPLEKSNKIRKKIDEKVYSLSYQRNRGLYVCKYIYLNSTIYLDRKFKKFQEYCRLYE
jgi:intein/homing endonuclease